MTKNKSINLIFGDLNTDNKKIRIEDKKPNCILIGPEGGWSQKEEKLADEAGLISFTLGHNTLRLENAAVCGLAVARESFIL